MTTHTWVTTATVPTAPWAAMCADMATLLAIAAASPGAAVTHPSGEGPPQLDAAGIAFTVTTPGGGPLTVTFTRQAGTGECVTNSPLTDGLVVATLARARRHFGALLTTDTDAGTAAKAAARRIAAELFDAGDRALVGQVGEPAAQAARLVADVVAQALRTVTERDPAAAVPARLQAVIDELSAERDGWVAAGVLVPPTAG